MVDCVAIAAIENIMYDMPAVLKNHKGLTILMNNILTNEAIRHSLEARNMWRVCTNKAVAVTHNPLNCRPPLDCSRPGAHSSLRAYWADRGRQVPFPRSEVTR